MATTLRDVKSDLIEEINRKGRIPEALLQRRIMMAIRFFERNYTLPYMRKFATLPILANSTEPGPYALPSYFKVFKFIRAVGDDGRFNYLRKVEPEDIGQIAVGLPSVYWLDADRWLWFDAIPTQDILVQVYGRIYTPELSDENSHWLFENAYDVIIGKSMELMLPFFRMTELKEHYVQMYTDALRTLVMADEEKTRGDSSVWMGMAGDPDE